MPSVQIRNDTSTGRNEDDALDGFNVRSGVIRDRVEPAASPGMVRYAAESGSELSCRDATGTNTMTETVTMIARRQACPRPRSEARDRQRVGTGAAPRLQPDLHRQARSRRRDPAAR